MTEEAKAKFFASMIKALALELHKKSPDALDALLNHFGFRPGDVSFRTTKHGRLRATVHRWPWEKTWNARPNPLELLPGEKPREAWKPKKGRPVPKPTLKDADR